jgi:hypothetical protein
MKKISRVAVAAAGAASLALVGTVGLGAASASANTTPQLVSSKCVMARPLVNGLRLRSGPSTHYAAYGLLYRVDRMQVIGTRVRPTTGKWLNVQLSRRSASGLRAGLRGWVSEPYVCWW